MSTSIPSNILLIDKPQGITSFDCIRILRRQFPRGTKIGHAGTLDPLATGLMIIGVGVGTKRLQDFLRLDKAYEAEILLGVRTDTGDITGKMLKELTGNWYELRTEEVQKTLEGMVGKLELPVPAYSAIKRGGEALYKKARRGEIVKTPIKTMEVKSVNFLGVCHSPEKGTREIMDHQIHENDRKVIVNRCRKALYFSTILTCLQFPS